MPTCPSCGKELPGEFPFCPFCAAPLTEQPAVSVREERKVVTVLFCDLVGFTATSEAADPEDVRSRIRPYHARLGREIERYGGTVEKFIGDAVMAVFGAPVAHEDDAERAVHAGRIQLPQASGWPTTPSAPASRGRSASASALPRSTCSPPADRSWRKRCCVS